MSRTIDEPTELERVAHWLDERTGFARVARSALRHVFPEHWAFLLGELALYCFITLVITGVFMTFFFAADGREVTYDGSFAPLVGAKMSAAYESVLNLSFEVRAGLLVRQLHHWAAIVFVGAIAVHMMRVFFTGAFRRPREINWLIGVTMLILALAEGFTGYSLPDDLLSGTGLRIAYGVAMAIPLVGPNLAFLLFGGEFPSEFIIGRLFVLHIMLLPALLIGAVSVHLLLVFVQKHTDFRHARSTETTIVGRRFWPVYAFRTVGLWLLTSAVLAAIGGLFQINPVWDYGPYLAYVATAPAQPDWYLGWLEGALRLGLPFEPTILGVTIPSAFLPAVVLPTALFGLIVVWPWVERRMTGDRRQHHVLDWPSEAPIRTATGMAVLSFFVVLTLAGANDVIAVTFRVNVELVTNVFRVMIIAVPIVSWLTVYQLCRQRSRHVGEAPLGGFALQRTSEGGFAEEEEQP